jgi:hypothetical protein
MSKDVKRREFYDAAFGAFEARRQGLQEGTVPSPRGRLQVTRGGRVTSFFGFFTAWFTGPSASTTSAAEEGPGKEATRAPE